MTRFNLRNEVKGDAEVVHVAGMMNEDAGVGLIQLLDGIGPRVVFNFKDLTNMNSRGVSAWLNFIRVFREGRAVAFEECPPVLVSQMNMIPSFALGVDVRTVYAPYHCHACNTRTKKLIKVEKSAGIPTLPRVACEKCRDPMELEDDPDDFFSFLLRE